MIDWIKKKIWWFLTATGIIVVAFAAQVDTNDATVFEFEGEVIHFAYTDENDNEEIIIRTDRDVYGAYGEAPVYFSVTNENNENEEVALRMLFSGNEHITSVEELSASVVEKQVDVYGDVSIACDQDWIKTSSLIEEDLYSCNQQIELCGRIEGMSCIRNGIVDTINVNDPVYTRTPLVVTTSENHIRRKPIATGLRIDKQTVFTLAKGETKYFQARVALNEKPLEKTGRKEFYIEAFGAQGGYGLLDPWFDTDFTYCRPITITAGGTSGGAATTTSSGYTILATTTLSTLRATSSGGNVQVLDSDEFLPFDIIFTDGTDCTDDAGQLLDYHFEYYDGSDGSIVAWVETTNMSSTSPTTLLMYYGNDSAIDQSDESGTYRSDYYSVWHLGSDGSTFPATFFDSTSNDKDLTPSSMSAANLTTAQIDGGTIFDGSADKMTTTGYYSSKINNTSMSAWVKTSTDRGTIICHDGDGYGNLDSIFSVGNGNVCGATAGKVTIETHGQSDGEKSCAESTTSVDDGIWHFVTGVVLENTFEIYVDGTQEVIDTGNSEPGFWGADGSTNLELATCQAEAGRFQNGELDEVRVYTSSLDPMDILTDYNNMADNTTFLSFGDEETQSVAATPDETQIMIIN